MKFFSACLLCVLSVLGGCTFTARQPETMLTLDAPVCAAPERPSSGSIPEVLIIAPTQAVSWLSGRAMVFSAAPGELRSYQFSFWAETPADRINFLMMSRLECEHLFQSVSDSNAGVEGRFTLVSELSNLVHITRPEPGLVLLELRIQLVDSVSRSVVARTTLSRQELVQRFDANGMAVASGAALNGLLADLVVWLRASLAASSHELRK